MVCLVTLSGPSILTASDVMRFMRERIKLRVSSSSFVEFNSIVVVFLLFLPFLGDVFISASRAKMDFRDQEVCFSSHSLVMPNLLKTEG